MKTFDSYARAVSATGRLSADGAAASCLPAGRVGLPAGGLGLAAGGVDSTDGWLVARSFAVVTMRPERSARLERSQAPISAKWSRVNSALGHAKPFAFTPSGPATGGPG